jgi:hypothetical protein
MDDARDEARKLIDRSLTFLRSVSGRIEEGVKRTYEASTLRIEISGLRRSLDEALRDLGRRVYDLVQHQGTLTAEEIQVAVGRVRHLEEAIADKERRIAKLEAEAAAPTDADRPRPAAAAPARPKAAPAKKTSPAAKKTTAPAKRTTAAAKKKTGARGTSAAAPAGRKTTPRSAPAAPKRRR